MPSPNGLAIPPVMRFSVVPKSVPFELERPDPSGFPNVPPIVATLQAWDRHDVHPAAVDIAVEAARDVYREVLFAEEQWRAENPGQRRDAPIEQASMQLHADMLCAVIEGLEPDEGLTLSRDGGPWQHILFVLGWWAVDPDAPVPSAEHTADADDDGNNPEAQGEAPATTTAGSSPDSAPSTAPVGGEN